MKDVTIKEINEFERVLLDLIGYDLVVKGAEYAKYYFILRTIAENNKIKMPIKPLSTEKVLKIQQTTNEFELVVRQQKEQIASFGQSM